MSNFERTPEYEREFKKLSKKYQNLSHDLETFKDVIAIYPTGIGASFTIIHSTEKLKIVKARIACKNLRKSSLRIIYAYHEDTVTFVYIELYFKGDKANEDSARVSNYISENK